MQPASVRLLDRLAVAGYAARSGKADVLLPVVRGLAPDELALLETLIEEAHAAGGPGGSLPPATLGPMPPADRRLLEPLAYASRGPDDLGVRARAVLLARLKGADPEAFAALEEAVRASA